MSPIQSKTLIIKVLLASVLLFLGYSVRAQTACEYQTWNQYGDGTITSVGATAQAACDGYVTYMIDVLGVIPANYGGYPTAQAIIPNCVVNWPAGQQNYTWLRNSCCPVGQQWDASGTACVPIEYFVVDTPPAQCDACNANSVAEPINPASGAMFDTVSDTASISNALPFKRFYNSADSGSGQLSGGWRYSYSRSIAVKYSTIATEPYVSSASTSSQYADPATACTSGFADIQAQVPQWSGAVASYAGGNCQLTKGGVFVGSLTVYSTGSGVIPASTPVAYDLIRDDGQLIRFIVDGSAISAPPGISLTLQQTALGFTINDNNNNVEQYDANGKLLSTTSHSGVVQTMNYDGLGRLSVVTDNFGHQLTLGYDSQNRLISVTRQ